MDASTMRQFIRLRGFNTKLCLSTFAPDLGCIGHLKTKNSVTRIDGFDLSRETILYYPSGREINSLYAAINEWLAIEFDERALQEAAIERLGRPLDLPQYITGNLPPPSAQSDCLDAQVQQSVRRPEVSRAIIRPILGTIAELMAGSTGNRLADMGARWRHRGFMLQRAEKYLQSNVGQPFDSKALAHAVGTTERNLQIHFKNVYGFTPGQWARCIALHRIRESLRRPESARFTVEGLAREGGFTHMGRFSRYYAELFGELPSETFRRSSESRLSFWKFTIICLTEFSRGATL